MQRISITVDESLAQAFDELIAKRGYQNALLSKRNVDHQHEHLDMVISSMHVHATHDTCVEAVIAKGPYDKLKVFCENTIAEKGVGCGEINYLPIHEHK